MNISNSEFPQLDAGMDGGFIQHTYRTGLARWVSGWLISTWICGKNIGIWWYLVWYCLSGTQNPSVLNKNLWKHFASFSGGKPHNRQHVDVSLHHFLVKWLVSSSQKTMFLRGSCMHPLGKVTTESWTHYKLPMTNHTHLTFVKFCRSKQYQTDCYVSQHVLLEAKADCTSSLCSAVPSC